MHGMIVEEYPSGAVGGADFFTRTARGEIVEMGPDGPVTRLEKVLITDRYVDMDDAIVGQICIGERTVRHLAHKFGMIDGWRVARVVDDNHALRSELVDLSAEVAKLRDAIRFLEEKEARPVERLYLGLDGSTHASLRACQEASAKALGVELKIVLDAHPVPLDDAPVEPVGQ